MRSVNNHLPHNHRTVLEVFVAPGCWGCDTASNLVESIRDQEIPGLRVEMIDLADPASIRPANVFAVPTYRLDGQVISLGNPDEAEIIDRLMVHAYQPQSLEKDDI